MVLPARFPRSWRLLGVFVLIFVSCERIVETLPPVGQAYYPIEEGRYKIYQIDSLLYDEYNCNTVRTRFQVKEVTGAAIIDGERATAYRIKRYQRITDADPWVLTEVWTEKLEDQQIQRVEDNQRMIKVVFPVKEGTTWDGVVYIRNDTLVPIRGGSIDLYKDWDRFEYGPVGQPYIDTVSNKVYEDAVQITQVDKTNNIERRYSTEVYAKGIGLVYKEMRILDTQCRIPRCVGQSDIATCIGTPWHIKAEKGFILKQSLLEHNYPL